MAAVLLFPVGLIFGSFATAVAHRIPRGESVVTGRSRCPGCGEQIAAYDNVPVLSWLVLRGRCRNCGVAISTRYPLTELAMAVLFVLTTVVLGTDDLGELALGLVFVALLVMVTLTDLERRVIPNSILIVGAAIGLGIIIGTDPSSLPERGIAAVAASGFLLVAALLYPRGMGMGDVKLAAVMGLFLGREVAPAMLVALVAGALYGVAIMLREGTAAGRKRAVPFGPFLAFGGLVGLLAGSEILDWYLDTFVG
jgi:leader peptidase (prepilin peptidase) / N-methyltransferase